MSWQFNSHLRKKWFLFRHWWSNHRPFFYLLATHCCTILWGNNAEAGHQCFHCCIYNANDSRMKGCGNRSGGVSRSSSWFLMERMWKQGWKAMCLWFILRAFIYKNVWILKKTTTYFFPILGSFFFSLWIFWRLLWGYWGKEDAHT